MSNKSAKRSKPTNRPLDPALLARSRALADKYQIVLQFADGEYYGRGLEMPLVMADGKTADECLANTREALACTIAHIFSSGKTPPPPAAEQARTAQVNVRLTAAERELLEQVAHRKGFRGLSDYVRHAALTTAE